MIPQCSANYHKQYQQQVTVQLKKYYPNLRRDLDYDSRRLVEIFYQLDLSKSISILRSTYSAHGPLPFDPAAMMRSILLSILTGYQSYTVWARQLHLNRLYAIISGFEPGCTPAAATFYDFIHKHLWSRMPKNFCEALRLPPARKVQKPKVKGDKADSIEKISVDDLYKKYDNKDPEIDARLEKLIALFIDIFVDGSVSRGLLDLDHLVLAGDGTPLQTSNRERSRLPDRTEEDDPFHPDPNKKRLYSQPDCDVGWDSSRGMFYSGYDLYLLTAVTGDHDLPVFATVQKASRHDSLSFIETWYQMLVAYKHQKKYLKVQELLLDSAHDNKATYQHFLDSGTKLLVDLNKRGTVEEIRRNYTLNDNGVPICSKGIALTRDGFADGAHTVYKYRCPYAYLGTDNIKAKCSCPCSDSDYGRVIKVSKASNPRLVCDPPRGSEEWKTEYKKRTGAERCNDKLKENLQLKNGRYRSSQMCYSRFFCSMMCLHLTAWELHANPKCEDAMADIA